ncbi:MFS transporter [Galactobacter caseinivorans]|uniref:Multidrug efflux pump Tap n=1 Tax=Galactobacter caseinivorans TaxID=2676123 RepID=A0A496PG01_9MICC|nr:MFS transporter [Galactobacter caseinivorans]RKW69533.1 MFS transporter [Galactobacter caseinivorans]
MSPAPAAHSTRLLGGAYPWWLVVDTATILNISLIGFAVPLLALMVTNSPAQAGLIGSIGIAIRVLTSMLGGIQADRHPRLRLMLLGALSGLALAAIFTALAAAQALSFPVLLALNAAMAARNGLFAPVTDAALKDLVPARALGRAQAANQGRDAVLSLAAAPLGGVLLAVGGWLLGATLIFSQLIASATAWVLLRRWTPQPGPEAEPGAVADPAASSTGPDPAARRRGHQELGSAFRWLWRRPDLRGALLVTTLVNLGFNVLVSTLVFAMQQDGVSVAQIGLVSGGMGAGMLLGATTAPWLVSRLPAGPLSIAGLVLLAAASATLPWITEPLGLAIALACSMLGTPALNAALLGYFMVATPPDMMGRASSIVSVFSTGAMPLSPLIAGVGLSLAGRTPTLLVGMGICVAAAALALGTRQLRRLPKEAQWTAHATAAAAPAGPAGPTRPARP